MATTHRKDGAVITPTRTSSTLFVKNIPSKVPQSVIEQLFGSDNRFSGFLRYRKIRGSMAFVDFKTNEDATSALTRLHGHKIPGSEYPEGLCVDFDKDDTTTKKAYYSKKIKRENVDRIVKKLYCTACGHEVASVVRPQEGKDFPRRSTDGSMMVSVKKALISLEAAKGEKKALKREGGVELQYRIHCLYCSVEVGYQSLPFESAEVKVVYFFENALGHKNAYLEQKRKGPDPSLVVIMSDEAKEHALLPVPELVSPLAEIAAARAAALAAQITKEIEEETQAEQGAALRGKRAGEEFSDAGGASTAMKRHRQE